jgi:hypothetical protein
VPEKDSQPVQRGWRRRRKLEDTSNAADEDHLLAEVVQEVTQPPAGVVARVPDLQLSFQESFASWIQGTWDSFLQHVACKLWAGKSRLAKPAEFSHLSYTADPYRAGLQDGSLLTPFGCVNA